MHFRASNPYDYYRPSKCERRVALRHRGVNESPRREFDDLLARLGASHATTHLDSLNGVKKLEGLDGESQERETLAAIRAGVPAIYQARFRVSLDLDGEQNDLVGLPDFLIRDGDGYIIRDSKLARRDESFRQIFQPDASPISDACARLPDPLEKTRICFQPVIKPVFLGFKPDQQTGRLSVASDDDLLAFCESKEFREAVLHLAERNPSHPRLATSASHFPAPFLSTIARTSTRSARMS